MANSIGWLKVKELDEDGLIIPADTTYYHEIVFEKPDRYEIALYKEVFLLEVTPNE